MNPDVPDEVIVRTDSEQFKVDFYIDQDHKVTQLDYEGYPLEIRVKDNKLITEDFSSKGEAPAA